MIKKIGTPEEKPQESSLPAGSADPNRPDPEHLKIAETYKGKKESDPAFNRFMQPWWKKLFGFSLPSIMGSGNAWCGLFVGVMLALAGLKTAPGGSLARMWGLGGNWGQVIEWHIDGIPKGAVVHINHNDVCVESDNHVFFAAGDCMASDIVEMEKAADGSYKAKMAKDSKGVLRPVIKKGAVVPSLGGNQSDAVTNAFYSAKEICSVRYPEGLKLPGRIVKSVNCPQKAVTGGSTR
jgi:hypothetical protein